MKRILKDLLGNGNCLFIFTICSCSANLCTLYDWYTTLQVNNLKCGSYIAVLQKKRQRNLFLTRPKEIISSDHKGRLLRKSLLTAQVRQIQNDIPSCPLQFLSFTTGCEHKPNYLARISEKLTGCVYCKPDRLIPLRFQRGITNRIVESDGRIFFLHLII